jgi:hypothetical protein
MSVLLEMPSATAVRPNREILQERLSAVYDGLFALLKQQYMVVDEGRVFAFLRRHSHLIPVLNEGRTAVSLFFGEETPVLLNLVRDPEIGGFEYLIAWVQTALPPAEAVDRLVEMGDTWFNTRLDIVGDRLNFNLGVL